MSTAGPLAVLAVALLGSLAGCGQKGPLSLPKAQEASAAQPAASAAAPAR